MPSGEQKVLSWATNLLNEKMNSSTVLTHLESDGIITHQDSVSIRDEKSTKQNQALIDCLHQKENFLDRFLFVLIETGQGHIVEIINEFLPTVGLESIDVDHQPAKLRSTALCIKKPTVPHDGTSVEVPLNEATNIRHSFNLEYHDSVVQQTSATTSFGTRALSIESDKTLPAVRFATEGPTDIMGDWWALKRTLGWMRTKVLIDDNGKLNATTRAWSASLWGFKGNVFVTLLDASKTPIWSSDMYRFGVNPKYLKGSDLTKEWSEQVPETVLPSIRSISIIHKHTPINTAVTWMGDICCIS